MKFTYHYSIDKSMFTFVGEGDFTSIPITAILLLLVKHIGEVDGNQREEAAEPEGEASGDQTRSEETEDESDTSDSYCGAV